MRCQILQIPQFEQALHPFVERIKSEIHNFSLFVEKNSETSSHDVYA